MASPFDPVRSRIEIQGFTGLSDERMRELDSWIRFTPFLNAMIAGLGALTGSAMLFVLLGTVALLGVVFRWHPFDLIYNHGIRALENSPELPPNTPRRRTVFFIVAAWAFAAVACFATGYPRWGFALGLGLGAAQGMVAALQICMISNAIHHVRGMFGR